MSDDHLRSLERRFKETGAVADEVVWLSARFRSGLVPERLLAAAAALGHPASREVASTTDAVTYGETLERLLAAGPAALIRAGIAATRAALTHVTHDDLVHVRDLLPEIEAWLLSPSTSLPGAAEKVGTGSHPMDSLLDQYAEHGDGSPPELVLRMAQGLVFMVRDTCREVKRGRDLTEPARHYPTQHRAQQIFLKGRVVLGELGEVDVAWDESALLERVRTEVVPWLLGVGDPVRDRVEEEAQTP